MIEAIVLLPLFGAAIAGLFCRNVSRNFAQSITTAAIFVALICALLTFKTVILDKQILTSTLFSWINIPMFKVSWTVTIDSLTAVMLIVVTSVSFLVHLYSVGYMHHDPHIQRFMAYLSLFTFAMLMLVTADNLLQVFFGWEGVGVCSYLLIGFWYHKESAYKAAIKAFLVNRVGDLAFIIGISCIYYLFGSINFSEIFTQIPNKLDSTFMVFGYAFNAIDFICLMLFLGAMGKSAQLGLHTWLPDAMEGPTPVSALIHAATMVTAGVFLVARFSPMFEYSADVRSFIVIIGSLTAMFAAIVAMTQTDIKKIIAYSTCSQLGYMFVACGLSAYPVAIFHLATHAFFKALLFLSAGSVIHAMSDEQNIFNMGNLWKKIPVTYAMFWIGSIAIAGFPPLAGYYSKDAIIESAFMSHGDIAKFAYFATVFAAFLTTFYSWRLLFNVFHGKANYNDEVASHVHESPLVMLVPLFVLAFGAVFSGYYGAEILGIIHENLAFWNGAIKVQEAHNILSEIHHTPQIIKILPLILGVIAIISAFAVYILIPNMKDTMKKYLKPVYKLSFNKFYFDEIYHKAFVEPFTKIAQKIWQLFDIKIVDGFGPNGFASATKQIAYKVSKAQTGLIYHYAFVMFIGLLGLLTYYIFW
ncbi:MAG: NADH-quinone oxidoreductase subunit L [Alphaproteobacteria bacterium]|nr:NADH-quinone oxidoreductase subunit L [Alphaproteobacteria bacterium]OJV12488.1 MAG: NADH-quinone oxidoreductase subunit L [Alphaproteobacteria bacterium 33-17]